MIDLSLILCSYNENGRIQSCVKDLISTFNAEQISYEIIFVDNGSTDGTREWISGAKTASSVVIFNGQNIGKGGSIRRGVDQASGRYVAIHDPDFEYRAKDVVAAYKKASQDDCDLVLGSRTLGRQKIYQYALNYYGVLFLTFIINLLYHQKLSDTATAIKVFKTSTFKSIGVACDGFDLDFEIVVLTAKSGGKISEVPAEFHPRTYDEGKKIRAFRDGLSSLRVILKHAFS